MVYGVVSVRTSEGGFSYLEVLVCVWILLLMMAVAVPAGKKIFMEAAVDYEIANLMGDMRWVQERGRTTIYQGKEHFPKSSPKNSNRYFITMWADGSGYQVLGAGRKGWTHTPLPGIAAVPSRSKENLRFEANGTTNTMTTIFVRYRRGEERSGRYIVLDKAGRMRVDRRAP